MERLFEAHARYERAMAQIKSLNLPIEVVADNLNPLLDLTAAIHMERAAREAEVALKLFWPLHEPADPAPNPINKRTEN